MNLLEIIGIWFMHIFAEFKLDLLVFGLFLFLILLYVFHHFGQKEKPPKLSFGSIGQIRQYLYQQRNARYREAFLLPGVQFYTRWERDVDVFIAFDKQFSAGERTALPKLRTQRAKDLFSLYLRLLEKERTNALTTDEKKQIIDNGGWHCLCSRYNPGYTDTCVCGKNKRDISPEFRKKILSEQNRWICSCGRANQHHVSTCVCGVNKRDISNINTQQ